MNGELIIRGVADRYTRYPDKRYHPFVLDWRNRVLKNGGVCVSTSTMLAVNRFYNHIRANGLVSKIKSCCCFVPDSLIAAATPLIHTYGNDPWTIIGPWVAEDNLSINGLTTTDNTQYLDTGVLAYQALPNSGSAGFTVYNLDAYVLNHLSDNIGYKNTYLNTEDIRMGSKGILGNGAYYFSYNGDFAGGDLVYYSDIPYLAFQGYTSGNRVAGEMRIYEGSSTVPHNTIASITATPSISAPSSLSPRSIYCFCINDNGGADASFFTTFSFAAIHEGLTILESNMFFQGIQIMRQELGGGFI